MTAGARHERKSSRAMGLGVYGSTAAWDVPGELTAVVWHMRTDPDGRDVYAWAVLNDDREVIASDREHDYVHTGCQGGDAHGALAALFNFLTADADAYSAHMGNGEPDDGYLFGEDVAEWAYGVADELAMASVEISEV